MPMFVSPEKMLIFSNVLLIVAATLTVIATIMVFYFGSLVTAKKQAELKTYQDTTGQQLSDANTKATQANNRADLSDKELQDLKHQQNNRILTSAQSATISDGLRPLSKRKVQIICPLENQKAYRFAKQIDRALTEGRWDTGAGIVRQPKLGADAGITIVGREDVKDGVQGLLYVLNAASVPSTMNITPAALLGHVQIYIGPKPM